ncbi:ROK family transcriptional regulator [Flavihumibacter sp. CACIAM 22H1]|uniref:ROK family transcriptional regulator n=1 Tax=Flavihumibacter sp. CACIAM 22H1 TaxID=1812911 RepID=UPI0007A828AA|nr:ROK family transcriptional regulator [Flavihumibacter sp. CACIAM 22H1]KYP15859.1 MAG: transcriptional regulator [Flavihumibacter sp. CACIAM 22H1]
MKISKLRALFTDEEQGGVAFKHLTRKREIIGLLDTQEECTIPEIAQNLNISIPTATSLVTELLEEGIIEDCGKIDSIAGRPANHYGLLSDACYFLGMDVRDKYINIGLLDFKKNLTHTDMEIPFELENTSQSLNRLIEILQNFLNGPQVKEKNIFSICINLTGRINTTNGYSFSFFHFSEEPLALYIENKVGIKVFLENDSRAMAYGEFHKGVVKNEKNVLFINIDTGLGLGILIDGKVYYGKSGFSGEFGHIPLFDNEIICHCGKKGCLETEASGRALLRMFNQKIQEGSVSSIFSSGGKLETITIQDIIEGARQDDVLCIELISKIGYNLGRGLAVLINLYNPELVILGGSLTATGDYLYLTTKIALNKYSLSLINSDSKLSISRLKEKAGILGSALIARNRTLSFY